MGACQSIPPRYERRYRKQTHSHWYNGRTHPREKNNTLKRRRRQITLHHLSKLIPPQKNVPPSLFQPSNLHYHSHSQSLRVSQSPSEFLPQNPTPKNPSLPVRLAPHPCLCGSHPIPSFSESLRVFLQKKYSTHYQHIIKNFQKKLRKNLQDKKNAVPLHPQMRQKHGLKIRNNTYIDIMLYSTKQRFKESSET